MEQQKDIRWKQRFQNFKNAFLFLEKALRIKDPSEVEEVGIIKSYEFTFELSWKTLKDYLEFKNISVKFPRDVIKEAFKYELIDDGDIWLDMLDKRNVMTHTYDETSARSAVLLIRDKYFSQLLKLYTLLTTKDQK